MQENSQSEKSSGPKMKLGEYRIYWQAQESSKERKRQGLQGQSGQTMKSQGPNFKNTYFSNTHSDISQYFLQCLLHNGS